MTYTQAVEYLETMLYASSDDIGVISTDPAVIKPTDSKVHVYIEPPTVNFEGYVERNYTFTLVLVSGRNTTQSQAVPLILSVIDDLFQHGITLSEARPIGWNLNGVELAAYELELGPLDTD